jgi:hypothetical protein
MRAAELCGAFRLAVGREDETKMVCQGQDDREFVRALSSVVIEAPKRMEIMPDSDPQRREVYLLRILCFLSVFKTQNVIIVIVNHIPSEMRVTIPIVEFQNTQREQDSQYENGQFNDYF